MPEKLDHLKGTVKEKAGRVTDDRDLEHEGTRDKAKGDAKKTIDDAGDAVKRGVNKL
jgi:uncharacterized protein YjbJ (UPF0337 family)